MKTYVITHEHEHGTSVFHFKSDNTAEELWANEEKILLALGIDYSGPEEENLTIDEVVIDAIPAIDVRAYNHMFSICFTVQSNNRHGATDEEIFDGLEKRIAALRGNPGEIQEAVGAPHDTISNVTGEGVNPMDEG